MPCLLVLFAFLAPRVVSVVLWLFTTFFERAFSANPLLLVLGVAILPFTTLAYAWAVNVEGGVNSPFFLVVMIVALLGDVSALEGGRRSRRGGS
jgi:hypothetical protein